MIITRFGFLTVYLFSLYNASLLTLTINPSYFIIASLDVGCITNRLVIYFHDQHTILSHAIRCRAVPCSVVPCRAMQCSAVPCRAVVNVVDSYCTFYTSFWETNNDNNNHNYLETIIPGCYHTWMLSYLDAIIPGCYHTWMLSYLDAIITGCYYT